MQLRPTKAVVALVRSHAHGMRYAGTWEPNEASTLRYNFTTLEYTYIHTFYWSTSCERSITS